MTAALSAASAAAPPPSLLPPPPPSPWEPSAVFGPAKPPPQDDRSQLAYQAELAFRQSHQSEFSNRDYSQSSKKLRARRTIDYFGEMGKWNLLRKVRPHSQYTPYPRSDPEFTIDLLPPAAYPTNSSTSLAEKFVHSSINKIRSPVNVVKWTPEGRRVLTGAQSGEFTLWNGLAFNFETILQAHDTPIRSICWSHSSRYLISSEDSGQIKYFQSNMNNLAALPGHAGHSCRALSFAQSDEKFVSVGDDGYVRIWDFEQRREERAWRGHGQDVRCVDWHPSKGLIVSGSTDDKVSFWDPRSGQALASYLHKNSVLAAQWNPNGNLVATGSRDTSVRVFDIRTFKQLEVFNGHKKDVACLSWHPIHHDILTSGDFDGTLIHWTLASPSPRLVLEKAHDSQIWSMDWHPLGHVLATGSQDFTTRFWCRNRPADEDPGNGQAAGYGGGGGLGGGTYNRVLASQEAQEKARLKKEQDRLAAEARMNAPRFEALPGLGGFNNGPNGGNSNGFPGSFPGSTPFPQSAFPPLPSSRPSLPPGTLPGLGGEQRGEPDYSVGSNNGPPGSGSQLGRPPVPSALTHAPSWSSGAGMMRPPPGQANSGGFGGGAGDGRGSMPPQAGAPQGGFGGRAPPQGGFNGPPPPHQQGFGGLPPAQHGFGGAPPPRQFGGFNGPPPAFNNGGGAAPAPQQGFGGPPQGQMGFNHGHPPPQQQQQGGWGAPHASAGGYNGAPGGFGGAQAGEYGAGGAMDEGGKRTRGTRGGVRNRSEYDGGGGGGGGWGGGQGGGHQGGWGGGY